MERGEQERSYLLKQALREELNKAEHKDTLKDAFKEALTEWLDDKWAAVGKWTWRGIAAAAFSYLIYLWGRAKGIV